MLKRIEKKYVMPTYLLQLQIHLLHPFSFQHTILPPIHNIHSHSLMNTHYNVHTLDATFRDLEADGNYKDTNLTLVNTQCTVCHGTGKGKKPLYSYDERKLSFCSVLFDCLISTMKYLLLFDVTTSLTSLIHQFFFFFKYISENRA